MNDITALMATMKAAAEKASNGEWVKESGDGWEATCSANDQANEGFIIAHFEGPDAAENREFIQAANPANVLALVEALEKAASEPVAWVRYCSDGTIDGPLMNYQIEDCRKSTWTPLYTVPPALESRTVTVKLPDRYSCELGYNSPNPNGDMLDRDDVLAMLAAAGIQVIEGEGQHGGNRE